MGNYNKFIFLIFRRLTNGRIIMKEIKQDLEYTERMVDEK